MNDEGRRLLQAVIDDPDPAHKYVYADWLDEHGWPDLAYAYRWAASRDHHPILTEKLRLANWCRRHKGTRKHYPHHLPRQVYEAMANGGFGGKGPIKRYRNLEGAFQKLSEALAMLRGIVEVKPRKVKPS